MDMCWYRCMVAALQLLAAAFAEYPRMWSKIGNLVTETAILPTSANKHITRSTYHRHPAQTKAYTDNTTPPPCHQPSPAPGGNPFSSLSRAKPQATPTLVNSTNGALGGESFGTWYGPRSMPGSCKPLSTGSSISRTRRDA